MLNTPVSLLQQYPIHSGTPPKLLRKLPDTIYTKYPIPRFILDALSICMNAANQHYTRRNYDSLLNIQVLNEGNSLTLFLTLDPLSTLSLDYGIYMSINVLYKKPSVSVHAVKHDTLSIGRNNTHVSTNNTIYTTYPITRLTSDALCMNAANQHYTRRNYDSLLNIQLQVLNEGNSLTLFLTLDPLSTSSLDYGIYISINFPIKFSISLEWSEHITRGHTSLLSIISHFQIPDKTIRITFFMTNVSKCISLSTHIIKLFHNTPNQPRALCYTAYAVTTKSQRAPLLFHSSETPISILRDQPAHDNYPYTFPITLLFSLMTSTKSTNTDLTSLTVHICNINCKRHDHQYLPASHSLFNLLNLYSTINSNARYPPRKTLSQQSRWIKRYINITKLSLQTYSSSATTKMPRFSATQLDMTNNIPTTGTHKPQPHIFSSEQLHHLHTSTIFNLIQFFQICIDSQCEDTLLQKIKISKTFKTNSNDNIHIQISYRLSLPMHHYFPIFLQLSSSLVRGPLI